MSHTVPSEGADDFEAEVAAKVEAHNQRLDFVLQCRQELDALFDGATTTDHLGENLDEAIAAIEAIAEGKGPVLKHEVSRFRTVIGRLMKKTGAGTSKAAKHRQRTRVRDFDEDTEQTNVEMTA